MTQPTPHVVVVTMKAAAPVLTCQGCDWTVSGWNAKAMWNRVLDHLDPSAADAKVTL